jgi:hypothetical protein
MSTITNQGLKIEFFKTHCIVKDLQDHYKNVASGVRVGGLYKLDVTSKDHQAFNFCDHAYRNSLAPKVWSH